MQQQLESSLSNIIQQSSLKWIFVGGKGGVGKTTTSCSLATQLAKSRPNVLLISTDPAHSLSDAFGQKLSSTPSLITGYSNLYAMEIDPNTSMKALGGAGGESSDDSLLGPLLSEFTSAIPGIDEAMGFAEVMKLVKSMEYSTIVFDTAPTGHTLRFLSFPATLERALQKLGEMSGKFGPLISQFSALMGGGGGANSAIPDPSQINSKLAELKAVVEEVNSQFQDPEKTTFVCVMIAEFLSLYETERMIQDLCRFQIDTHNLVVNQLVFPETADCGICQARRKMQKKYLDQIDDLYGEDFHIVKLPLLKQEVRGAEEIKRFSRFLIEPYDQGK